MRSRFLPLFAAATMAFAADPPVGETRHPFVDREKMKQKLSEQWETPPPGARGLAVEPPPSVTVTILFKYDSAEIADDLSLKQLIEAAAAFKSAELRGFKFIVEGHTDSDGEEAYNQKLSERRASAVVKLLTEQHSVESAMLSPLGKGEIDPVADNTSDAGKQKNRRVVIVRSK